MVFSRYLPQLEIPTLEVKTSIIRLLTILSKCTKGIQAGMWRGIRKWWGDLKKAVEGAKRVLSSQQSVRIEIEAFEGGNDFWETLTRAKFEKINGDYSGGRWCLSNEFWRTQRSKRVKSTRCAGFQSVLLLQLTVDHPPNLDCPCRWLNAHSKSKTTPWRTLRWERAF